MRYCILYARQGITSISGTLSAALKRVISQEEIYLLRQNYLKNGSKYSKILQNDDIKRI